MVSLRAVDSGYIEYMSSLSGGHSGASAMARGCTRGGISWFSLYRVEYPVCALD